MAIFSEVSAIISLNRFSTLLICTPTPFVMLIIHRLSFKHMLGIVFSFHNFFTFFTSWIWSSAYLVFRPTFIILSPLAYYWTFNLVWNLIHWTLTSRLWDWFFLRYNTRKERNKSSEVGYSITLVILREKWEGSLSGDENGNQDRWQGWRRDNY